MRNLPAPLGKLEIPAVFGVTAVAAHQGCDLKMVTGARSFAPFKLPPGPDAAIGRLIHSALDMAQISNASADEIFEQCLDLARVELSRDADQAHFSDLSKARSGMDWRNVRTTTIAKIERVRALRPTNFRSLQAPHGTKRFGSEITRSSADLRLIGRADKITKEGPGLIVITDFKTGQILGSDGVVLDSIRRQLFLYALLTEESERGMSVHLRVESLGAEYSIEWTDDERVQIRTELARIAERLPAGSILNAVEISKPGDECRLCSLRMSCSAYIKAASQWWKEVPSDMTSPPVDTWGTLLSIKADTTEEQRSMIEIQDAAGRIVKVTGLRRHRALENLSLGDQIFAFSLEASGGGKGWDGSRFHPHTFHELPPDRHSKRAWSATLFSKSGQP